MTSQTGSQFNFSTDSGPKTVCILRLSAIGDICHALPVVRTLQQHWPQTRLTWVIGKLEYSLVGDIPGIEFIIFDKDAGFSAYRELRNKMRGRRFDVLLHMQMSLRASLASLLIPAIIRLGFDRRRARDMQWLFSNRKISFKDKQHVMDSFFGFTETLGISEHVLQWGIPISADTRDAVSRLVPSSPYLVISPCSSMAYRNWSIEGYAQVADYAYERYGLIPVVTGGKSDIEQHYAEQITQISHAPVVNLTGKTSLKELMVVLEQAYVVVAPDSGPAHMATAVNTPVIGLYACTNPDRARPYNSDRYTVNKYPDAVINKYGKPVDVLPWGIRVREPGTMERITAPSVQEKLDLLMAGAKQKDHL